MVIGHARPSSSSNNLIRISARLRGVRGSSITSVVAASRNRHQLVTSAQPKHIDLITTRRLSDLGLRSQRPPDTIPDPKDSPPPEVPDQEWEVRTGRAIYVIQETLPEFFQTGLFTSINKATGAPTRPSSSFVPSANINFLEYDLPKDDAEAIYSPSVRLSYTPPVALPAPFPKTFHVEGIQLYLASSSFIRHTMNALYSDLMVTTTKLTINTPPSLSTRSDEKSAGRKRRINREKSFLLRQIVTGTARVSGKPGEWEIESTYTFSPLTGLIHQHVIDSIRPAPHQAVYDTLRLSLGKLLGLASPTPSNGAACKGSITGRKS